MKIQCDVCEKAAATVICCADEAALCSKCDIEVHAANKLASKHQRLLLECLSNKLPRCDICQEKAAFIFCVEDRAMFCKGCDESIHSANNLSANHQRYLATGIRVALNSNCINKENLDTKIEPPPPPPKYITQNVAPKSITSHISPGITSPSWAVDDLLQFDYDSDKKEFGEAAEWWKEIGSFGEQVAHQETSAAAEVPQLYGYQSSNTFSYRSSSRYTYMPNKKPRIEVTQDDDDEFFTVPDLG